MWSKKVLMFVMSVIAGIIVSQVGTPLAYGEDNAEPKLPKLVDLGASKCIPCKKMAPILDELREEYRGRMDVIFIDVWQNPEESQPYGIESIPTQIFYDADGKELFRHEGFFPREEILAKWSELGIDLSPKKAEVTRTEPKGTDTRPSEEVCFMCDGTNAAKTLVEVKTSTQPIRFCSIHCYFIYRTSLKDVKGIDEKVRVTDWETGKTLSAVKAVYLVGLDDKKRSLIKVFATKESALKEREKNGGNLMDWTSLSSKEQAIRCGFCDRAVYAEDSCLVKVGGLNTYGCCPMCALGVAARLQKDIEVEAFDALTGEPIHVTITNGSVSDLKPKTALAWAGQKKNAEGKMVSAGCFKQAFFANETNLKTWLEKNPTATGKMITIDQALQAKMKMTKEQIRGACKIGECDTKK
jgi:thioredoxin 1